MNPSLDQSSLIRLMSRKWLSITEQEKEAFEKKAALDVER